MDLEKDIFGAYKKDFQNGQFGVGNLCNADCFFCSQKWNPPGVTKDLRRFLTMEEIEGLIEESGQTKMLFISSAIHTNNGEFLLHPQAPEILEFLRNKKVLFPRSTFLFTNGLGLSEELIKLIKKLSLTVVLSLNSANVGIRKKMMGNSYSKNKNAIDSIELFEKYGLNYFIDIVPVRSNLDNGDLENTIKFLKSSKVLEIEIFRPGFTKLTPEPIAKELSIDDKELIEFVSLMATKYKVNISSLTLSHAEIKNYLLQLLEYFFYNNKDLIKKRKLFLCSEAAKDVFPIVLEELKMEEYEFEVVKSRVFGGNVNSSGLLLVEDYIYTIHEFLERKKTRPECLILPSAGFDVNNEDIRMISYKEIENKFGIKVYLVPNFCYDERKKSWIVMKLSKQGYWCGT